MSERLLAFVNSLVGRLKGGLGAVTIVTCALFGAISGSSSAAIAAIGSIMIPRMVREGYPPGHATALVACSYGSRTDDPALNSHDRLLRSPGGISVGAALSLDPSFRRPADGRLCRPELPVPAEGEDDHGRGAGADPRRGVRRGHHGHPGLLGASAARWRREIGVHSHPLRRDRRHKSRASGTSLRPARPCSTHGGGDQTSSRWTSMSCPP